MINVEVVVDPFGKKSGHLIKCFLIELCIASLYLRLPEDLRVDYIEVQELREDFIVVPRRVNCELEACLQLKQLEVVQALPLVVHVKLADDWNAEFELVPAFQTNTILDLDHVEGLAIEHICIQLKKDLEPRMLDGPIFGVPFWLWPHLHNVLGQLEP